MTTIGSNLISQGAVKAGITANCKDFIIKVFQMIIFFIQNDLLLPKVDIPILTFFLKRPVVGKTLHLHHQIKRCSPVPRPSSLLPKCTNVQQPQDLSLPRFSSNKSVPNKERIRIRLEDPSPKQPSFIECIFSPRQSRNLLTE